jgi:glycosyltransferase involved in cell wall biosynthesis
LADIGIGSAHWSVHLNGDVEFSVSRTMVMEKTVLFVSHDANRAGATIIFLNFLRWFKEKTNIPFIALVCRRGEMDGEFEKLSPVWYLDRKVGRKAALRAAIRTLTGGLLNKNVVGYADLAARIGSGRKVGLIYSNTVANGRVLEALSPLGCPILTHVHELEYSIRTYAGEDFEYVKRHSDHFVVVSDAVRENLIIRHGIPEEKIERIYGFVPTMARPRADAPALKRAIATEIGIPENARIVGGCGTVDWRKGCDLFLQLALAIRARTPTFPVHLLWLGEKPPGEGFYALQHDLDHAGLTNFVHFIGSRANPLDYIAAFDVFALVSREDPFPLVIMEAAALGVPTVCFDGGGGGGEFVEADAGCLVPYLDLGAMAERVLELLDSNELRFRLGQRAQEKVRERHDIEVAAPKLSRVIERLLARGNAVEAASRKIGPDLS